MIPAFIQDEKNQMVITCLWLNLVSELNSLSLTLNFLSKSEGEWLIFTSIYIPQLYLNPLKNKCLKKGVSLLVQVKSETQGNNRHK